MQAEKKIEEKKLLLEEMGQQIKEKVEGIGKMAAVIEKLNISSTTSIFLNI